METINLAFVRLLGFSAHTLKLLLRCHMFSATNAEQMLDDQGEPRGHIIMDWFAADLADLVQLRCFGDCINLCVHCCKQFSHPHTFRP